MTLEKAKQIAEILEVDPAIFFEKKVQDTSTSLVENKKTVLLS